jgi:hypothetical protein
MSDDQAPTTPTEQSEPADATAEPLPGQIVTKGVNRRQSTGPWRGHGPRPWGALSPTS